LLGYSSEGSTNCRTDSDPLFSPRRLNASLNYDLHKVRGLGFYDLMFSVSLLIQTLVKHLVELYLGMVLLSKSLRVVHTGLDKKLVWTNLRINSLNFS
jgi:hypothetical protein